MAQDPKEQIASWVDRIKNDSKLTQDLKSLDAELSSSVFLVGTSPTEADWALLSALYPIVTVQDKRAQQATPSVTRYVSHLSHLSSTSNGAASGSVAPFDPDYESMPPITRIDPAAAKKEKAAAKAGKEGGAAPPSSVTGVKEAAAAATTSELPAGEGKPKKDKKEKKEKGAAAAAAGAGGKAAKGGDGGAGGGSAAGPDLSAPEPWMVDLRVGKIVKVERHPDADSLYVESIDFGEPDGPRTILSGLVAFVPIERMQDRWVVGVCNLKPVAMRGIKSFGMVLCATAKNGKEGGVEPVDPPEGSAVGDRVYVEGYEGRAPLDVLPPKKKIFEAVQPAYLTTATGDAGWKGKGPADAEADKEERLRLLKTDKGIVTSKNFPEATLS